ncbi:MAG: metallophosphoesterase [Pseudobacteriovorax sp.]|nr:metallophosphoesterase [Pseudobacteriovorax sp.]
MTAQSTQLVAVSDIHIHSPDDQRAQTLLALIDKLMDQPPVYFVLIGDIFDICLGNHKFFQKRFSEIGKSLERLASSGTKVFFVEGNHEFRIEKMPWKGIHFVTQPDIMLPLDDRISIKIAHGDLIYSHNRYKRFRKFIKSPVVTGLLSWFPGKLLNYLATGSAQISRAQDEYRDISHEKILGAANAWLSSSSATFGMFGHFHVPYAEPRKDGRTGQLLSMKSWDEPNALVFKDNAFYRWNLQNGVDGELDLAVPLLSNN